MGGSYRVDELETLYFAQRRESWRRCEPDEVRTGASVMGQARNRRHGPCGYPSGQSLVSVAAGAAETTEEIDCAAWTRTVG